MTATLTDPDVQLNERIWYELKSHLLNSSLSFSHFGSVCLKAAALARRLSIQITGKAR